MITLDQFSYSVVQVQYHLHPETAGDKVTRKAARKAEYANMKNLHDADLLGRQASNALLIAASRAAMARCRRAVRISDQLMRASARLIPRSSLRAPPWQTPSEGERRAVEVLQQIGISLRSSAEEIVVKSRETRCQARQIRMQSGALRSRLRQAC